MMRLKRWRARLDGVGGAPVGFGSNGGVNGVRLLLVNPVVAAATEGDGGRRRTVRLERRPALGERRRTRGERFRRRRWLGLEGIGRGLLGDPLYRHGRERSGLERKESRRENLGFGGEINSKTNPNSRRIQRDKTGFLGEEIEEDKGNISPQLILEKLERGGRIWKEEAAVVHAHGRQSALPELEDEQWRREAKQTSAELLLLGPIEGGTKARLWERIRPAERKEEWAEN